MQTECTRQLAISGNYTLELFMTADEPPRPVRGVGWPGRLMTMSLARVMTMPCQYHGTSGCKTIMTPHATLGANAQHSTLNTFCLRRMDGLEWAQKAMTTKQRNTIHE